MSHVAMHEQRSLTKTQLREISAELARESRRFEPDDPRADAFADALRRIESGSYGYCAKCGNAIPPERLAVVPETVYCVDYRKDNS